MSNEPLSCASLQDPQRQDSYRQATAHTARIAAGLAKAQRELDGRVIMIPTAFDPARIDFAGLPLGIELQRHQLTISFGTATELREKYR